VEQTTDKVFQLPVNIDVWNGNNVSRHQVWVKDKVDTFRFAATAKPSLVNFDADKILIVQKTENKNLDEYLFQYKNAHNYIDRREAIDAALKKQQEATAAQLIMLAMRDRFAPLRLYTVNSLDMSNGQIKTGVESILAELAQKDTDRRVKAAAIAKLGLYKSAKYAPLFRSAVNDSSYSVSGFALDALSKIDSAGAVSEARRLSAFPSKGRLANVIKKIMSATDANAGATILKNFEDMPFGQAKFQALEGVFDLLESTSSFDLFKRGVDDVLAVGQSAPESFREQIVTALNTALREMQKKKASEGQKEMADYLDTKLPKEKGF
jgi:aminopeptidase N